MVRFTTVLVLASVSFAPMHAQPQPAASAWRQYTSVADAGFDPEKLAAARAFAEQAGSDAVLIVHQGRVVAAWGDPARRFKTASIRKSLLSLMFGAPSVMKSMRLDATLADLNIDDREPLSVRERSATVAHLLSARSGVYHPAAREPASMTAARPRRGSAGPGESWFYNNWDFNALGTIYTRFAGHDLFTGFRSTLADPLGFEDYRPRDGYAIREPSKSQHAAYEFTLSARDLAKVGQLVLQQGTWNGREIVSRKWLAESLRVRSPFPEGGGYAYLWWIDAGRFRTDGKALPAQDAVLDIAATGLGGQLMLIVPEWDVVFVHLNDGETRGIDSAAFELADLVLQARRGPAKAHAAVESVTAVALPNVPPPMPERTAVPLTGQPADYVGLYELSPAVRPVIRFTDGGLFVDMPGRGEAELFQEAPDRFFLKVTDVTLTFERDASGRVVGARMTERGKTIAVRKVPSQ